MDPPPFLLAYWFSGSIWLVQGRQAERQTGRQAGQSESQASQASIAGSPLSVVTHKLSPKIMTRNPLKSIELSVDICPAQRLITKAS